VQSLEKETDSELEAVIQENGNVLFYNVFRDEYNLLDELGSYKDHEPIDGYEHLFIPHLCA